MNSIAAVKDVVQRWACSESAVRRVWIFGSVAKGKQRPNDLDLAVEIETPEPTLFWIDHSTKWHAQLQAQLPLKLQLEYFDPKGSTSTVQSGLAEARHLIYERAS